MYGNMKNNIAMINLHNQDYPFLISIPHSGTYIPDAKANYWK